MIVADTSAWVEFFRGSDHPVHLAMRDIVEADEDMATTGVIVMELLAGEPSAGRVEAIKDTLMEYPLLPLAGPEPFEDAAGIYRACRSGGETVRGTIDCLIAAIAIRADALLLHNDRDFDVIARHTELRIQPVEF